MRIPRLPHSWTLSPRAAVEVQRRLACRVVPEGDPGTVRTVAGIDCAFSRDGSRCLAAVVVWDVEAAEVVETLSASRPLTFPYVPGLLSFREGPAIIAALRRVRSEPDLLMFDGQGIAHPRRFGIASHIGVLIDRPSIGCAKSRLVGDPVEPAPERGARRALIDRGERIGTVLRTRDGVKPLYISVGHRIDLARAERWTLRLARGYRLPEPTRRADRRVAELRRGREEGA